MADVSNQDLEDDEISWSKNMTLEILVELKDKDEDNFSNLWQVQLDSFQASRATIDEVGFLPTDVKSQRKKWQQDEDPLTWSHMRRKILKKFIS